MQNLQDGFLRKLYFQMVFQIYALIYVASASTFVHQPAYFRFFKQYNSWNY